MASWMDVWMYGWVICGGEGKEAERSVKLSGV